MKYGIIDIGSNSVRLMLWENGVTLFKRVETTKLSEGLANGGRLLPERMAATAKAALFFKEFAEKEGAVVRAFATEAVRRADNRDEFISPLVGAGLALDVLDSKTEALLGFSGAYDFGRVAVVDVGGASTEIAVGDQRGAEYAVSVPLGVVKLKNLCGENRAKIDAYLRTCVSEYGKIPAAPRLLAIGGTAGTLAAIRDKSEIYIPEKIHGSKLDKEEILTIAETILSTPPERRGKIVGLPENRADITAGGALILAAVLDKLSLSCLYVSESDNLEGYAKLVAKP